MNRKDRQKIEDAAIKVFRSFRDKGIDVRIVRDDQGIPVKIERMPDHLWADPKPGSYDDFLDALAPIMGYLLDHGEDAENRLK